MENVMRIVHRAIVGVQFDVTINVFLIFLKQLLYE